MDSWHHQVTDSPGFAEVRRVVLEAASPVPGDRCADLGAGTGFLALPLAGLTRSVLAVDASRAMLEALERDADVAHPVSTLACDLAELDLPEGSLDLIVSSYALHHLEHADKRALARRARRWLAPGGRMVVADMMFGRGGRPEDRAILASKVRALAAKGPGGWVRVAKNAVRFGLGVGSERPASPDFWVRAFEEAGFVDVTYRSIVAEAGLVVARRG
ncbi:MAG: class I SAM-dependent methyltransferase [Mycobacteriales bacterium]